MAKRMPGNSRRAWKARVLWGLCAFSLITTLSAAQDLPPSLQEVFRAGVVAQKAGHLEEAEQAFRRVLREGGEIAYVHNNLGIVYQQRGDHARAMAQFRAAIRLQPDYAAPRILLGASLLATGHAVEAAGQLERAVKLEPRQALARLELAKAYERTGNVPGLVEQYRALRELAPQDPEYAYQLGQAYSRQAEWSLREIRRLNSHSVRIYQILGEAYHAQGRVDLAIRAFQRAAQIDPKLPGIHLSLAQIYWQQGQVGEARQQAEVELAIVPESVAARAFLARIPSGEGKP
jgi:tetratricopeptide (TPR) repeat protein